MAGDRVGERGLAGAVRPHDRVRLPGADREVNAAQDLPAGARRILHADVEVADLQDVLGSHLLISPGLAARRTRRRRPSSPRRSPPAWWPAARWAGRSWDRSRT